MKLRLGLLLIFGLLAVFHCEKLSADDHEEDEGEEGPDDDADPGGDPTKLSHFEDDGSHDQLTREHMQLLHTKLDEDSNGKVSMSEIMAFSQNAKKNIAKKEIAGMFNEIEATKDGHLSFEEHMSDSEEVHADADEEEKKVMREVEAKKFKAADANGDGKLDAHELTSLMHPDTHPEVLEIHVEDEMRKRDENKDGQLSKAEWGEHQSTVGEDGLEHGGFDELDGNKDGHIDIAELRHFESGRFHTEWAMRKLYDLADKDDDAHFSEQELMNVADDIDGHASHPHILDWVFHDEM